MLINLQGGDCYIVSILWGAVYDYHYPISCLTFLAHPLVRESTSAQIAPPSQTPETIQNHNQKCYFRWQKDINGDINISIGYKQLSLLQGIL